MQLKPIQIGKKKGQTQALNVVVGLAMMVIVCAVLLYAGLFATSEMADAAAIANTSDFYDTYTDLTDNTESNFGTVNIAIVLGVFVGVLGLLMGLIYYGKR